MDEESGRDVQRTYKVFKRRLSHSGVRYENLSGTYLKPIRNLSGTYQKPMPAGREREEGGMRLLDFVAHKSVGLALTDNQQLISLQHFGDRWCRGRRDR